MTSSIEKAIEKARAAKVGARGRPSPEEPPTGNIQATGLYRVLTPVELDTRQMERSKIIAELSDKAAITAYKVLRTRVLHVIRGNGWRNIIVSGAGPGEGKTLTACNLAVSIARDVNQSVYLIDLDLQRPSIGKYFGLDVKLGLGDYLSGNAEIDDIVYAPDGMERIAIIPNREPIEHASELIAGPRMKALMKWLKERGASPLAIFDMPPILACDDVLAFLPSADALLLVASEGITQRSEFARALEMLGEADLLGVVLNRSREHRKSTAYY
jgi:protein-tyrosine kinase